MQLISFHHLVLIKSATFSPFSISHSSLPQLLAMNLNASISQEMITKLLLERCSVSPQATLLSHMNGVPHMTPLNYLYHSLCCYFCLKTPLICRMGWTDKFHLGQALASHKSYIRECCSRTLKSMSFKTMKIYTVFHQRKD